MPANSELTDLYLAVGDCEAAIDFFTAVFGGRETQRECLLDGHITHAEVALSPYRLQLSEQDECSPEPPEAAAGDGLAALLNDPFGYQWSLRFVARTR